MKYKILTPNAQYNGITEGVAFVNGVGHTDSETIKNILVNDYGYNAEAQEEKPKKASSKSSAK